jgi:FAD/FMN-containing dehydrogenase
VIRCAGTADILRAVEFARSQSLLVAVRGGGHCVAGFSTCDDGVVIDTSPMKGIRVDPVNRTVVAQAGVTGAELDHETQAFGLALTGGLVSSTGIGGFTLGGGLGWLLRLCGLTCDNLVSADVVTADGQLVTASETSHPDLFWALRDGGNFGVVTSYTYRLHPVGPVVFVGPVFYPGESAAQVLRGWRDLTATLPDELTTLANVLVAPPAPFLPDAVHGHLVVGIVGVYAGPVEAGAEASAGRRDLAEPVADLMGPMPYAAMQTPCSTRCGGQVPATTSPRRCSARSATTPSTRCCRATQPGPLRCGNCTCTTAGEPWPGSRRTPPRTHTVRRHTC